MVLRVETRNGAARPAPRHSFSSVLLVHRLFYLYITDMRERIDPGSPLPLYLQVAEAIRYRVATGDIKAGAKLPSLRGAARGWAVNMHTIRRAYAHLEEQGIVRIRPKIGTIVLSPASALPAVAPRPASAGEFLAWVVREARERWSLSAPELVRLLRALDSPEEEGDPLVHVVECSELQAGDLARQLAARYRVRALPWSLDRAEEPPRGAVVATYFHYNDIRCRWPHRFADVHFMATHPDPALHARIPRRADGPPGAEPTEVLLCEREPAMARNIAADLTRILPPPGFLVRTTLEEPALLLQRAAGPVLFAPRVWGEMSPALRTHPCALEVRYVFRSRDLNAIRGELAWTPRA